MRIDTAVFGQIEVDSHQLFHFPEGLYGFEDKQDYALITRQEDDVTLRWLQATDSRCPCFILLDPREILGEYSPALEETDLRQLGCKDPSELELLSIAVVPENVAETTVNLKSPVALNRKTRKARQIILSGSEYPLQFPLFAKGEEREEEPRED